MSFTSLSLSRSTYTHTIARDRSIQIEGPWCNQRKDDGRDDENIFINIAWTVDVWTGEEPVVCGYARSSIRSAGRRHLVDGVWLHHGANIDMEGRRASERAREREKSMILIEENKEIEKEREGKRLSMTLIHIGLFSPSLFSILIWPIQSTMTICVSGMFKRCLITSFLMTRTVSQSHWSHIPQTRVRMMIKPSVILIKRMSVCLCERARYMDE